VEHVQRAPATARLARALVPDQGPGQLGGLAQAAMVHAAGAPKARASLPRAAEPRHIPIAPELGPVHVPHDEARLVGGHTAPPNDHHASAIDSDSSKAASRAPSHLNRPGAYSKIMSKVNGIRAITKAPPSARPCSGAPRRSGLPCSFP